MCAKAKITVIRRPFFPDISVMSYGKEIGPCDFYHDGQEFVLDQNGPHGYWHLMGGVFCSEAWAAISNYVDAILQGGSFDTASGENFKTACCPDGIRPVVFKVERAENASNELVAPEF